MQITIGPVTTGGQKRITREAFSNQASGRSRSILSGVVSAYALVKRRETLKGGATHAAHGGIDSAKAGGLFNGVKVPEISVVYQLATKDSDKALLLSGAVFSKPSTKLRAFGYFGKYVCSVLGIGALPYSLNYKS